MHVVIFAETGGAGEGVLAQADMASLPYNPVSEWNRLLTLHENVLLTGYDWSSLRGSPSK